MDSLKNIKERRSIRKFKKEVIADETIKELVEYARYSPSWKNSQSVRYIAIKDTQLKQDIADYCVMDFKYNQETISNAPTIMLILTKEKRSGYDRDGNFSTSKQTHWESFDAGIATQTLMLAAYALNIATVTLGIYDEQKIIETLDLKKGFKVSAIVAMGYYESNVLPPKRKSVDELLIIK